MQKPVMWTGALAGIVVGACSRVIGFAFGKALAFTYAVIVSVVANVVFDFVREPPHPPPPEGVAVAALTNTDGPAARAPLPAASTSVAPTVSRPTVSPAQVPPASVPPAPSPDSARPGPGSGGLY
jgi:hypothetical protein